MEKYFQLDRSQHFNFFFSKYVISFFFKAKFLKIGYSAAIPLQMKKNVYKIVRLWKRKRRKKLFSAQFFFVRVVRAIIFLVALFPPPSFHKFLCVLDIKKIIKRKRTCFFFNNLFWKKGKKIDLHNTAKSIRGISTKMKNLKKI